MTSVTSLKTFQGILHSQLSNNLKGHVTDDDGGVKHLSNIFIKQYESVIANKIIEKLKNLHLLSFSYR